MVSSHNDRLRKRRRSRFLRKSTQAIEEIIDREDPIEDFYYLEVSSPGVERVLKRKEHFASVVGLTVDIKLFAPDEKGRKPLRGVLKSAD